MGIVYLSSPTSTLPMIASSGVKISDCSLCPAIQFNPFQRSSLSLSSKSLLLPRRSRLSGKSFWVAATSLDEKEKIKLEEIRVPERFPGQEINQSPVDSSSAEPGVFEKWVIKTEQSVNVALTDSVIQILDVFYRDRNYARFYVLETIARVPYFAFISVLHLYESFGWWRKADYIKVHFAESWNELHHLLIMEELGGNSLWFDRFLSQHIATFYYFMTVFMYILSPRMAYHFSECVEKHAYSTYDKFLNRYSDELKSLPAPEIAIKYYTTGDLYLFDEFQTSRVPKSRRPEIENLYDVFINIRDDEGEHCKTMKACQSRGNLQSPHSNPDYLGNDSSSKGDGYRMENKD